MLCAVLPRLALRLRQCLQHRMPLEISSRNLLPNLLTPNMFRFVTNRERTENSKNIVRKNMQPMSRMSILRALQDAETFLRTVQPAGLF